jgi:hypothetical protein
LTTIRLALRAPGRRADTSRIPWATGKPKLFPGRWLPGRPQLPTTHRTDGERAFEYYVAQYPEQPERVQRLLWKHDREQRRLQELNAHLKKHKFPERPLRCTVELELRHQGKSHNLYCIFSVNGWKEEWCLGGWASLESESAKRRIDEIRERFPGNLLNDASMILTTEPMPPGLGSTYFPLGKRSRQRGGSKAAFDLAGLARIHRTLHPKWKDAKRLFTQNRNLDWRSIVKVAYPDLPDDLIKLLGEKGSSAPSHIALEHAARTCGATPFAYSVRWLRAQYDQQSGNESGRKRQR